MNFTPDPVAFTVFGLEIRWYAVLICIGIILAVVITGAKAPSRGISKDDLLDIILISVPVGIIGARVWYVLFNLENYHSFLDMINIRNGGLAIHGGLIFGFAAALIMCRKKGINPLNAFDTAVPCIALAQAIGRWGNFCNGEAYGSPTDLPWAITIDGVTVHPTFLYESLWCFFLFIFLSAKDKNKAFNGQTFCLYGILYSAERFFVEQLRTDSLLAGPKDMVVALKAAGYDPNLVEGVVHAGDILIMPFKTAQFISIASIVILTAAYSILKRKKAGKAKKH